MYLRCNLCKYGVLKLILNTFQFCSPTCQAWFPSRGPYSTLAPPCGVFSPPSPRPPGPFPGGDFQSSKSPTMDFFTPNIVADSSFSSFIVRHPLHLTFSLPLLHNLALYFHQRIESCIDWSFNLLSHISGMWAVSGYSQKSACCQRLWRQTKKELIIDWLVLTKIRARQHCRLNQYIYKY